jgi:hypothetical protein
MATPATVNVDVFTLALQHFAQTVGASKQKQIVLVLDPAGWHKSLALTVPERLHLLFLPPSSPELQQALHLWSLSNEPLINWHFSDLAELEEVQAERCVFLQDSPELIRSQTSLRLQASPQRKTLVITRKRRYFPSFLLEWRNELEM